MRLSVEQAKNFLDAASYLNTPILLGIAPFKSLGMMKWMVEFVPGIKVPEEIQDRIRKAKERGGKEAIFAENIEVFSQMIREIRKTTNATEIHMMAVGFEWIVPKIIEHTRLK